MNKQAVQEIVPEIHPEDGELPEGWVTTSLRSVVHNWKGKKPKILKEETFPEAVPYIDIKAFESGEIRRYADTDTSVITKKGDILMARVVAWLVVHPQGVLLVQP